MKKLITLCLSALLAVGGVSGASPAKRNAGTAKARPEGKPLVVNPRSAVGLGTRQTGVRAGAGAFAGIHRISGGSTLSKAPARIGATGSTVYGILAWDESGTYPTQSITEVFSDGTITPLIRIPAGPSGGTMSVKVMYVRDGKFHCLSQETASGVFLLGNYELVFDMDGVLVSSTTYDSDDIMFNYAGYDPIDDKLYGYVETSSAMYYATASGDTPNKVTLVAEMPADAIRVCCMTYNCVNEELVGCGTWADEGKVVRIDKVDGSQTELARLANPSQFITGLCYSSIDNAYWYAVCTNEYSGIQLLDESDFSVTTACPPYATLTEFAGLYCSDVRTIAPSAPGEATLVDIVFADGALDGTATYRLPATTFSGTPVLGNVVWTLYVDNVEVKRGSGAAGSEIVIPVSGLAEGNHIFKMVCSLGGNEGKYNLKSYYVGNDTPKAPSSVTFTKDLVSWTPVTEGIHEGYVNATEVTYNVYVNGEQIASGVKATECVPEFPSGATISKFVASVEAVFDGKVSDRTNSNDVKYGEPFELPVSFVPTSNEADFFTIVDANGDGNTIGFMIENLTHIYTELPVFRYAYSSLNQGDDWLFLPVTKYDDADAVYEFSFNAFRIMSSWQESFEVKLCTSPTPESAVKTLIDNTYILNDYVASDEALVETALNNRYTADFNVPSAGAYYIGVHVTSPRDMLRVYMRDFRVEKLDGVTISGPQAVTGLNAVGADAGVLSAAVSFTFPTASLEGMTYDPSVSLSATVRAEDCEAVTVSGKPGETVTVTAPTKQGDNAVTVYAMDGEKKGVPAYVSVYTGLVRPGSVCDFAIGADATGYTAHLTWAAPTEGMDGGYVSPEGIKYYLCKFVDDQYGGSWEVGDEIGTDVYEYDYTVPEGTEQSLVRLGVIAENFVGRSSYLVGAGVVIGKPFELPVSTVNSSLEDLLQPISMYSNGWELVVGDPSLDYPEFATDDNLSALYPRASYDSDVRYSVPMFSTRNTTNPAIRLHTYGGSTSEFSVAVAAYGIDRKVVKTFKASDFSQKGPQDVVVELGSDFAGKDWIEISFISHVGPSDSFILYGYKVFDNLPYDFGVYAVEGPSLASIGEEARYVAHVFNYGSEANPMPAYGWKLTDEEGNVVADVNVPAGTENVAPETDLTFDIAFTPNAEQIGKLKLAFNIEKADDKGLNDSMMREIEVTRGRVPVVTDLRAEEISHDNVKLVWSPAEAENGVSESFEEETPMVLDDISATVAGFKRVDGDKGSVYGPQNMNYEALPTAFKPQSFVVWSTEEMAQVLGDADIYHSRTGDKYLIAFCPSPQEDGSVPASDDWLISPELDRGSSFGFSIRPITYQYGVERVEVMYSTSGDNPEDFKLLERLEVGSGMPASASTTWEDYSFVLPSDARYFAIHYVSNDIFGIMIDDIAYAPFGSGIKMQGYDIYRDGRMIASNAPCEDGVYADATVMENVEYRYMVVPVLTDGTRGLDSNILTIRTTGVSGIEAAARAVYAVAGAVMVEGYEGETVEIAGADGIVKARRTAVSASERFELTDGIYVVKAGKDVVKIIVKNR